MVLFDEDPVTLISETTNQFHIAPDKDSIARISSSLSALATSRTSRIEGQQLALKSLSRRLNTIKSQHEYEQGRRDTAKHASEVLALDGEKFRIAKAVNEVEVEGERLSSELISLRRTCDQLKSQGVEGGTTSSPEADAAVLKLQLYRSLGIDLVQDSSHNYTAAVIRNLEREDVNIVDLDSTDDSFRSDRIWQSM